MTIRTGLLDLLLRHATAILFVVVFIYFGLGAEHGHRPTSDIAGRTP